MNNGGGKMRNGRKGRAVPVKYRLACRQKCWVVEFTVKEKSRSCVVLIGR